MVDQRKSIIQDRLAVCARCEHLSSKGTCGTPVVGSVVTHQGKRMKTCGCFVKAKVTFLALSCPLGKWPAHISVSEEIRQRAKNLIASINPFHISPAQKSELFEISGKMTENKMSETACPSCVQSVYNELKSLVDRDDSVSC